MIDKTAINKIKTKKYWISVILQRHSNKKIYGSDTERNTEINRRIEENRESYINLHC